MKLYLKEEEFYELMTEKMQRYGIPIFFRDCGVDKIQFKHLPSIELTHMNVYHSDGGASYFITIRHN